MDGWNGCWNWLVGYINGRFDGLWFGGKGGLGRIGEGRLVGKVCFVVVGCGGWLISLVER